MIARLIRMVRKEKTMNETTAPETQESLDDALNEARQAARTIEGALHRMAGEHATGGEGVYTLGQRRARLNAELADAHRREGAAEIAVLSAQHAAARIREEAAPGALAEAEAALAEATRAAEAAKQARDTAERRVLALRAEQGRRQMHMREMENRLGVLGAPPSRTTPWPEAGRQPVSVAPGRRER